MEIYKNGKSIQILFICDRLWTLPTKENKYETSADKRKLWANFKEFCRLSCYAISHMLQHKQRGQNSQRVKYKHRVRNSQQG